MKKFLLGLAMALSFSNVVYANVQNDEEFIPENDSDYAVQILDPRVKSQMIKRAMLESQKRAKTASCTTSDQTFPKN